MLNPIKVPHGAGRELAKAFNCTPAKISQALNATRPNTDLSQKIRHTAITEFKGVEFKAIKS